MQRTMKLMAALATIWVAATPLLAQVQIEKRRPASADGTVSIDNSFGSVTVRGWEQNEVLVQGELAPGSGGLDLDGDKEEVYIDLHEPDRWFYAPADDSDFRSRLEVFVPAGSSVYVETVNATIDVTGVRGELDLRSVNGSISAVAHNRPVEVETMTGTVDVTAEGAPISVESINGDVTLRGAAREVEVYSVEGAVSIEGSGLASVDVETVTGAVAVTGTLAVRGELAVETFSGAVTLTLPPDVRAEFEIETFSGEIESDLGPKKPTSERFEPYRTLQFSTGFDEYEIEITTHEGNVDLQVAAGVGG